MLSFPLIIIWRIPFEMIIMLRNYSIPSVHARREGETDADVSDAQALTGKK